MMMFTCLLFATALWAQKSDFSGSWMFVSQESISGRLYANGSPNQITLRQNDHSIQIEKKTAGNGSDITVAETLPFDGKPVQTTTSSKKKKIILLKWGDDGKSFTESADIYGDDGGKVAFKYTDAYSLIDGKLVLIRKVENTSNGESWQSRAIYQKP